MDLQWSKSGAVAGQQDLRQLLTFFKGFYPSGIWKKIKLEPQYSTLPRMFFLLSRVTGSICIHQSHNTQTRQPVRGASCYLCSIGPHALCIPTLVAYNQEPARAANVEVCSARKASS